MIIAAVAMAAAITQAASVSWTTNGKVVMPTGVGTKTGNITATKISVYYWAESVAGSAADIWKSQFNYNDSDKVWTAKAGTTHSDTYNSGALTVKDTANTFEKDDTAYGTVVLFYDVDGSGTINAGDYFLADSSYWTFESGDSKGVKLNNLATANWAAIPSGGPSPVPEPTSGLLLLLGVAGMALRRRRA